MGETPRSDPPQFRCPRLGWPLLSFMTRSRENSKRTPASPEQATLLRNQKRISRLRPPYSPDASPAVSSRPRARCVTVSLSTRIASPAQVSYCPRAHGAHFSRTEKLSCTFTVSGFFRHFFFFFNLSKQPISVNQVKSNLN